MDKQKPYSGKGLINFLSFFFNVFFYLLVVITIITIVFMGYSLLSIQNPEGFQPPVNFQVFFSLEDDMGNTHWNSEVNSSFSIAYAMGTAPLPHVPYGFMAIFCLMAIIMFVLMAISIRLTIRILKTIKDKSFLLLENAFRLRWIALLSIGILLVDKLSTILTSSYIKDHIEFAGIKFVTMNLYSLINIETIFNSLFLLVIAEVFRIGAKLKEEHDLTI